MINASSLEFIQKVKDKDSDAITWLIENYHDALIKGALKQGLSFDQAEEVVQNTWGTFFEKAHNFEGRSHIRTYLFGIMYNKVKETWRSNKKYTHDFDDQAIEKITSSDDHHEKPPLEPDQWVLNDEFRRVLMRELDKLPETQRMAFYLKEIQGEDTETICKIMDVTNTNLGVLIFRAKNSLRLKLEKELNK